MNRNFRVIWNESLNCFTAVAECAKARGKSTQSSVSANASINTTTSQSTINALRLSAIGLGLLAAGFTLPAAAVGTNFTSTNAQSSTFDGADLRNSIFLNASLSRSTFVDADLAGSNLSDAGVNQAELTRTNLQNATGIPWQSQNATYDATVCPDGVTRNTTCWP